MSTNMFVGATNHIDFTPLRQWNKSEPIQLETLKESYFEGSRKNPTNALEQLEKDASALAKDNLIQKLINCVTSSKSKEPFIKATLTTYVLSHVKKPSTAELDKLHTNIFEIFSHCPIDTIKSATMAKQESGHDAVCFPVGKRNIYFGPSILMLDENKMDCHKANYTAFIGTVLTPSPKQPSTHESIIPPQNDNNHTQANFGTSDIVQRPPQTTEQKLASYTEFEMQDFINDLLKAKDINKNTVFHTRAGNLDFAAAKKALYFLFEQPVYLQATGSDWTASAKNLKDSFDSADGNEKYPPERFVDPSNNLKVVVQPSSERKNKSGENPTTPPPEDVIQSVPRQLSIDNKELDAKLKNLSIKAWDWLLTGLDTELSNLKNNVDFCKNLKVEYGLPNIGMINLEGYDTALKDFSQLDAKSINYILSKATEHTKGFGQSGFYSTMIRDARKAIADIANTANTAKAPLGAIAPAGATALTEINSGIPGISFIQYPKNLEDFLKGLEKTPTLRSMYNAVSNHAINSTNNFYADLDGRALIKNIATALESDKNADSYVISFSLANSNFISVKIKFHRENLGSALDTISFDDAEDKKLVDDLKERYKL